MKPADWVECTLLMRGMKYNLVYAIAVIPTRKMYIYRAALSAKPVRIVELSNVKYYTKVRESQDTSAYSSGSSQRHTIGYLQVGALTFRLENLNDDKKWMSLIKIVNEQQLQQQQQQQSSSTSK